MTKLAIKNGYEIVRTCGFFEPFRLICCSAGYFNFLRPGNSAFRGGGVERTPTHVQGMCGCVRACVCVRCSGRNLVV